jgi:hypothetical protein
MELQVGDHLIARGWNWSAKTLQASAERDLRSQLAADEKDPVASVSVFAMVHDGSEDVESLKVRLVEHVSSVLNSKYIGFTSGSKLEDEGFAMRPNEPPRHHYDILTPDLTDMTRFEKLSESFEDKRKAAR